MNRRIVLLIFPLLFVLALNIRSSGTAKAGTVWRVDDDGSADFQTVQDAVDAAGNGDTIFVKNGIYREILSVTKAITLAGENPFNTIIDARGRSIYTILIEADNVRVRNLSLCNSAASWFIYQGGGVYLYFSNGCSIENCIMVNNSNGINLYRSSYNNISNNLVTGSGTGIQVFEFSNSNLIKGNWVSNNSENGDDMYIHLSYDNAIVENNFYTRRWLVHGPATGSVSRNNFVSDAPIKLDSSSGPIDFTWEKDGEGNFWMDYSGVDDNGDGIGDTPYVINETNTDPHIINKSSNDSFPLMRPYGWVQGDVNYDSTVNIVDLAIIAKAFGSHLGDTKWNPRCDLNNDKSTDILDITLAATNFRKKMR